MHKADRYDSLINFYATKYRLNPKLIKSQVLAESDCNPEATSPVGAVGLMQFMEGTWKDFGNGDRTNPEASIEAGCKYMRSMLESFDEIPDMNERYKFALASYNAGKGNINKLLSKARESEGLPSRFQTWKSEGSKTGKWQTWEYASKYLPYITGKNSKETLQYVDKILKVKE